MGPAASVPPAWAGPAGQRKRHEEAPEGPWSSADVRRTHRTLSHRLRRSRRTQRRSATKVAAAALARVRARLGSARPVRGPRRRLIRASPARPVAGAVTAARPTRAGAAASRPSVLVGAPVAGPTRANMPVALACGGRTAASRRSPAVAEVSGRYALVPEVGPQPCLPQVPIQPAPTDQCTSITARSFAVSGGAAASQSSGHELHHRRQRPGGTDEYRQPAPTLVSPSSPPYRT